MRNLGLLILLAGTFLSCSDNSHSAGSEPIELAGIPPGAVQEEFADSPGLVKVSVNDNSGKVIAQGLFLNQKRAGSWIEYSATGKIKSLTTYVDGKKEGTMVELNESGQLLRQSNFHNDLQEGEYKEFNYGTVKEERFYKLGKLEGTVKIFYADGKLMEEGLYTNGVRDGISKWYDQQGNMTIEYEYKAGVLIKK